VDGVSTYNILLPHVVSYIPTIESLQEVNIVTNSFDAEQGLAGGAAVNLQTKSGTNQMHGSAFEYHTNNHLKAWPDQIDDPQLNTGNKPKQVYNQLGGTLDTHSCGGHFVLAAELSLDPPVALGDSDRVHQGTRA